MLNLGRIVLSLCLGAQIVSVDAIAKDESPPTLARRRPQLICTLQAGRPKEGDCWKAFEDIPKNDPMRYIFGPGDKAVTFETPKFFLYGSCAIGIYNSPVKYQRDVSDWFPLRLGIGELIDTCAGGLAVGGYYEGWGYNQNLMLTMFAWSPTLDIGKLPSVLEITKRVDQSCEAAVAATPPDKGNTASVSDCSGSSDKQQCLKGASSSRASGFCAAGNNDDCCKDYTCVPTISSNSEILFGYLSSTVSLVGQCLMTQSSPIVKPRRAGRRILSRHEKQIQKRASPRKRANDPFCNQEFGTPNYDHCDAAWHQVPIDNIQRWFYNGNYDALPTGTPKPIEQLPQSWQSGNCVVQVKFQLEEELKPEPERERDPFGNIDEGSRTVPYSPFLYRPFDETTWDLIDNTALDILGGCVENHQLGGQDIAVSQYNKLEVTVYSLDSLWRRDQDREAAQRAADAASDDTSMGGTTESEDGPGTPRNQVMKPLNGMTSPAQSPYWFMNNCPTGTIYCATDKDCGAACGPGQSCKLTQIVSNAIITGITIAHELGSCFPSSVL